MKIIFKEKFANPQNFQPSKYTVIDLAVFYNYQFQQKDFGDINYCRQHINSVLLNKFYHIIHICNFVLVSCYPPLKQGLGNLYTYDCAYNR